MIKKILLISLTASLWTVFLPSNFVNAQNKKSKISNFINNNITNTPKKNTQESKTQSYSNSYEIVSPHGHKFLVEIDYIVKEKNTLNNDCKAQYIITNIGTIDYIQRQQFPTEKIERNGRSVQNFDLAPSLIFEFTTADGKKIEASVSLQDDILVGKSTAIKDVQVDVGHRICVGEVKPIRINYLKFFN